MKITYIHLQDGDRITDPKGVTWTVSNVKVELNLDLVRFVITAGSKRHNMRKFLSEPVEVERQSGGTPAEHDVAVQTVKNGTPAEVVAEFTPGQEAAAEAATPEAPLIEVPFDQMDQPEMWTHLYLLHGVEAHDVTNRDHLVQMHSEAHLKAEAGKLRSKLKPHRHTEAVK